MGCATLTSVSLPSATSIGMNAFARCGALKSVTVSWELLANVDRNFWGLSANAEVSGPVTKQGIESGSYALAVECGDKIISAADYASACAAYDVIPKEKPQAETVEDCYDTGDHLVQSFPIGKVRTVRLRSDDGGDRGCGRGD